MHGISGEIPRSWGSVRGGRGMTNSAIGPKGVSQPRVLVIDDEPGLCDMLRYGLPKRGFHVECASNGEAGLALAREQIFDLVVCDIMMPGLNGLEVLKKLKEITPDTQVIMATGFATLDTAIESMKRGAFDYLTKPYGLPQICAVLDKAMEWRQLRARVGHLEEVNRLKDEFMATISHELRTPITVIMGYSSLLQDIDYSREEGKNGLRVIESKAKDLLQIINNILNLANISAHRDPLVLELCSAAEIAQEVHKALRPIAQTKKLNFVLEIQPDLMFKTDRNKAKQVLLQLAENALKFTKEGTVTLRVDAADDRSVCFAVQDTGIGIKDEDVAVIFKYFTQVDQSITRNHGGTGLGLAVCRGFVQLLDGTLSLTSELGKGSTFTVLLPGRPPAPVLPNVMTPGEESATHNGKSCGILLVVDDDPAFTRLFQNLLSREGYDVSIAGGGAEAIRLMGENKPDAILLDLNMPDVTGFEVIAAMQKDPRLEGVKVFVVTSQDLSEAERAKILGRAEMIIQKGTKDLPEMLALLNKRLQPAPHL
jgi:signal transduction histidine kinase